jgi:hypothetical protein
MLQSRLVAGETLNYRLTVADYPASAGWAMRLILNPRAGGTVITVNGTADGDEHLIQIQAGVTVNWTPGQYAWEIWAINGGEQYQVEGGQIQIVPGLIGAVAGADTRTQAQKALDDARAALAAWTPTQRRYRIAGREMEFNDSAAILRVISYWENECKREEAAQALAAGRPNPRRLLVRLGRA